MPADSHLWHKITLTELQLYLYSHTDFDKISLTFTLFCKQFHLQTNEWKPMIAGISSVSRDINHKN